MLVLKEMLTEILWEREKKIITKGKVELYWCYSLDLDSQGLLFCGLASRVALFGQGRALGDREQSFGH